MPELPEVETVCRVMRRALEGRRIVHVEVVQDPLVFSGESVRGIEKALGGVGRPKRCARKATAAKGTERSL